MSEQTPPPQDPGQPPTPPPPPPAYGQQPPPGYPPPPPPGYAPPPGYPTPYPAAPPAPPGQAFMPGYQPGQLGPIGRVRGTGVSILLAVVTLGIYPIIWYYKVHEEMKQHTGVGLGGLVALLLALFVGVASPFLASGEVGDLYARQGREKPVSGLTGLWVIPGFLLFIVVGPLIWFVKTNGALNDYWRSMGAQG